MSIFSKRKKQEVSAPASVALARQKDVESVRRSSNLPDMDEHGEDPMSRIYFGRIIAYPDGFGYEICKGEAVHIVQRYHPEKAGNVPMTQDEAQSMADKLLLTYGRA
jgi:hypothetical protein